MEKFLTRATLGLLFVTPLLFLPFTQEYFETPKAYFLTFSGFVLFFAVLFTQQGFAHYLKELAHNTLWQLVGGFWLVLAIASFFGTDFATSFWGSVNQQNGLLLFYVLIKIASVISYFVNSHKLTVDDIYKTLLYSAVWVSVIGIVKYALNALGLVDFSELMFDGREVSTLGQPNFFAFYVAVAVLFILFANTSKQKVTFYALLLVASLLAASKSGLLLFGLNTVVLLVQNKNYNVNKKYVSYFVILLLVGINIGLVLSKTTRYEQFIDSPSSYQYRRVTALTHKPSSAEEDRIVLLTLAYKASLQRLVLGYGKGHVDSALYAQVQQSQLQDKGVVDSSHNLFLDTTLEGGLCATVILVAIFGLLGLQAVKQHDVTRLFVLIAVVLNGMVHNTSNVVFMLIFVLIGMYLVKTKNT